MTQAISSASASSFASELAVLLVENESNQSEAARIQRDAARQEFLDQSAKQVAALHDAADATTNGALVSAAFSVAGGACQIGAASAQYKVDNLKATDGSCVDEASYQLKASVLGALASTSDKLAAPADALFKGTAERYQAEAKRHETLGEQAKWQSSDASSSIDKADKQSDKVLDLLQGIQRDQNSSTNSIIGRI
jgi:hypothetical protein